MQKQVARFASLQCDFEWKLYGHERPATLGQWLIAFGFRPEPEEALLVADAAELSTEIALPEGVRLLPVTDAAGVRLVVQAHEKAFVAEHSSLKRRLLLHLRWQDRVRPRHAVRQPVGRWNRARVASPRRLQGPGRLPNPPCGGARLSLPPGRRAARQPTYPGPTWLRPTRHDRPVPVRAPSPGAWAHAVAVRDVILSPLPAALAIPLGVDAGWAALSALMTIAERVDPIGIVAPSIQACAASASKITVGGPPW